MKKMLIFLLFYLTIQIAHPAGERCGEDDAEDDSRGEIKLTRSRIEWNREKDNTPLLLTLAFSYITRIIQGAKKKNLNSEFLGLLLNLNL